MSFVPTYAPTPAFSGAGDAVFISIDGGSTYTQIMGTDKMNYDGQSIGFDEVTNTTSPSAVKEFFPTLENPGDFTFDCVFISSDPGQILLAAAYKAKTKLSVAHVYKAQPGQTAGPINQFVGWVQKNPQAGSDVAKAAKRSVSIKISSVITTTPATTS